MDKKVRKKVPAWSVIAFGIVILAALACFFSYGYFVKSGAVDAKQAAADIDPKTAVTIEIPAGATTGDITEILKKKGLVKHPLTFRILSRVNGYDGRYQAGTHILSAGLKYDEMMRILVEKPQSISVTIPEGFTYGQIKKELSGKGLINMKEFDETARNGSFDYEFLKGLGNISVRSSRLEGYLFPDTYEFDVNAGEGYIIKVMLDNFDRKFRKEFYGRAKTLGMTADRIVTLASIIEREAKRPEERSLISGVFYNRLRSRDISMRKLQSCATVQYILYKKYGHYADTVSISDTKIDDPYNTYVYEGLPPGPICSPGLASIEAALYPEKTDYMFFAAIGDGYHRFSRTYSEHLAVIRQYGIK